VWSVGIGVGVAIGVVLKYGVMSLFFSSAST